MQREVVPGFGCHVGEEASSGVASSVAQRVHEEGGVQVSGGLVEVESVVEVGWCYVM